MVLVSTVSRPGDVTHDDQVGIDPAAIARAGHHAAEARLASYAAAPNVAVRRGAGWFAVRTGVRSNDMNGVVSEVNTAVSRELVDDLIAWFRAASAPASWLTIRADPQLTHTLVAAGACPERTAYWSGRAMFTTAPTRRRDIDVVRVTSLDYLEDWLDIATRCGWINDDSDRTARSRLYQAVGLDHCPLTHWLALKHDEPVGFASSYLDSTVIDLCNLGVDEPHRRSGIGRSLIIARCEDAAAEAATTIVSAPSPDGWPLQRTLGFHSVPVIPDTWFYLPAR